MEVRAATGGLEAGRGYSSAHTTTTLFSTAIASFINLPPGAQGSSIPPTWPTPVVFLAGAVAILTAVRCGAPAMRAEWPPPILSFQGKQSRPVLCPALPVGRFETNRKTAIAKRGRNDSRKARLSGHGSVFSGAGLLQRWHTFPTTVQKKAELTKAGCPLQAQPQGPPPAAGRGLSCGREGSHPLS